MNATRISQSRSSSSSLTERQIFIGGLTPGTKEDSIYELFSVFGTIASIELSSKNKKSRGFATITFEQRQSVAKALSTKSLILKGREVNIMPCLQGEELDEYLSQFNNRRVFLRKIPKRLKLSELKANLKFFGELEFCYQIKTNEKWNIGYATFVKQSSAKAAVSAKKLKLANGHGHILFSKYKRKTTIDQGKNSQKNNKKVQKNRAKINPDSKHGDKFQNSREDHGQELRVTSRTKIHLQGLNPLHEALRAIASSDCRPCSKKWFILRLSLKIYEHPGYNLQFHRIEDWIMPYKLKHNM